jgi:hypothetical protein
MRLSKTASDEEAAEQLMRHRARVLPFLTLLFLFMQVDLGKKIATTGEFDPERTLAWLLMGGALLASVAGSGIEVLMRPGLRRYLNDELTRSHRLRAFTFAFGAVTAAALGLLVASGWVALSAYQAIHALLTIGTACAVLRYAYLERRALGR